MSKFKWLALLTGFLVIILTSFPVIYFSLFPKDNLAFLKRNYVNSQDTYTYASFIEQAKQGRVLFENLYTSEPQKALLVRPSYVAIGVLAKILNLDSINAYHLSRILLCGIFFIVLWKFLDHFIKDEKSKFITFCLILTSSGIGIFVAKYLPDSIDLWVPEANTFLMLSEAPHFILSQILMLLGFMFFFKFLSQKNVSDIVTTHLLFLFLSFEHPFNLIVIIPVLFVTALWNKMSIENSILVSLGSTPGLLIQYYLTKTNPILSSWESQNILYSPSLIRYLTGFGGLIVLSILSLESILKDKLTIPQKTVIVWIVTTGFLIYAPFDFQRRFIEGVHIPIAILSSYGLFIIAQKYREKAHLISVLVVMFLGLTSIYSIYVNFWEISKDKADAYYFHIDKAEKEAIVWLGQNTNTKDIVLSNWYIGNLVPGMIGRKVYLGHAIQTINWEGKRKQIETLIQSGNVELAKIFFDENQITIVFIAKNDLLIRSGFKPENYPFLVKIYSQDGVDIYRVSKE